MNVILWHIISQINLMKYVNQHEYPVSKTVGGPKEFYISFTQVPNKKESITVTRLRWLKQLSIRPKATSLDVAPPLLSDQVRGCSLAQHTPPSSIKLIRKHKCKITNYVSAAFTWLIDHVNNLQSIAMPVTVRSLFLTHSSSSLTHRPITRHGYLTWGQFTGILIMK